MLDATKAFSGFSVDNIENAMNFYRNVLGLDAAAGPMPGTMSLKVNGNPTFVYQKDDHSPATYTVLNFPVDNLDETVTELAGKGVRFEHYDGPLGTNAKGIHEDEHVKVAWFRDPAGNYLSVMENTK